MFAAGMVFAVLAAALHVLIFYMESIAWEGPLARSTFGGTPEEARPHAFYAFNQGFYNLFLALQALIGVALAALGHTGVGAALMLAGTGAMLAAALVLGVSSAPHRVAAAKQGALPLLAVASTVVALLA
ncbi:MULTISPECIES: DUF1304 domain-containing protein [Actinomyces]|uniref:DUF1304 domain-containing protein n=1 Tax=Actinomyces respiraculi TaxID=2744574 RepID=A0A7T0LMR9_9ACTO|nr:MULTISPECIES: DUF1304 domain-containing protein [Actinomyces]QPL06525.1 DUF1304 domain-containing protein [Actinomyces respiraculi]